MPSLGVQWMVIVRAPFSMFLWSGLEFGTCDTSLIVFKEGSHSPDLSSIPLAGCILRSGELGIIQLNGWVSVGLYVSL